MKRSHPQVEKINAAIKTMHEILFKFLGKIKVISLGFPTIQASVAEGPQWH